MVTAKQTYLKQINILVNIMNYLSKLQFKNFRLVSDLIINLHSNLNIIASNKAGVDCSVVLKGLSITLNDLSYSKQELNRRENKDMFLQLYLNKSETMSSSNNEESLDIDSPIIQYNQHTWHGGYSPLFDYVQNVMRQPYSHDVELDKAFIDGMNSTDSILYLDLPKDRDYFSYPESKDFFNKFVSVLNRVLQPTGWSYDGLVTGYIRDCYLKHPNLNRLPLDKFGYDIQFIFKLLFKLCCHKNSNMDYKDVVYIQVYNNH